MGHNSENSVEQIEKNMDESDYQLLSLVHIESFIGTNGPQTISCHALIEELRQAFTQARKPYYEIELADATGKIKLRIWSDQPAYAFFETAHKGECIELSGRCEVNGFGLNISQAEARLLSNEEREIFFSGTPEQLQKNMDDWDFLKLTFANLQDPRLRIITLLALEKYEKKWRRAAAARTFHHARRGGLLEHVTQMIRCAQGIAPLYSEVFPDLLYTGVLFHDIGKLWENDVNEQSFSSEINRRGELLGHIAIGFEVVNQLWREAREQHEEIFSQTQPSSDLLRDHVLHLIVSHHGQLEFGSPVTPRTPEAMILHHIDNIDAKIEMLRCAYREKQELVPGVFDKRYPLEGLPIAPILLQK
jgi:3'-5' exoribonuclease